MDKPGDLTEQERQTLDLTKEALAVVSGLQTKEPEDVPKHLASVRENAIRGTLTREILDYVQRERRGTSAEELYVNRKVLDLVTKAEMEREDYRRKSSPNVFFGTTRKYPMLLWTSQPAQDQVKNTWLGFYIDYVEIRTIWLNALVLVASLALVIAAIQVSLKRQLTKV